ncbi:MAG: hypothetical protein IPJ36_18360 [Simplicispira sp.]|nr:hypothetical protein [Simplicispira sp.]
MKICLAARLTTDQEVVPIGLADVRALPAHQPARLQEQNRPFYCVLGAKTWKHMNNCAKRFAACTLRIAL